MILDSMSRRIDSRRRGGVARGEGERGKGWPPGTVQGEDCSTGGCSGARREVDRAAMGTKQSAVCSLQRPCKPLRVRKLADLRGGPSSRC